LDPIKPTLILPEVADESKWRQGKPHYREPAREHSLTRFSPLATGGTDVLLGTFKDKGLLQPIRPLLVLP